LALLSLLSLCDIVVFFFPHTYQKQEMSNPDDQTWTNAFKNGIVPIDFRKSEVVAACAEFVVFETLISYLVRYFVKTQRRSLVNLLMVHSASIPFFGAFKSKGPDLGLEAPLSEQVMEGIQQVEGVFIAEYLVNTPAGGIRIPKPQFADILCTVAAKVISRPMMSLLYPYLGSTVRNHQDILDEVIGRFQYLGFQGDVTKQVNIGLPHGTQADPGRGGTFSAPARLRTN
jgi:hypothetical protein